MDGPGRPVDETGGFPERAPPPPSSRVSDRLGPYQLERLVGQGGMGAVYAAWDPRLGRRVAVKVILAEQAGPEASRRFIVEAQASARLHHPAIVRVHESGEDRGRRFIAMDLVEGEPLQTRLDRGGPLDARVAAAIARRLADALSHAHEAGVLHRDVKPHNVLLTSPDTPVLTDFGLAKQSGDEALTRTGDNHGTPAFMPPEQIDDLKRVDARADVYGLGATLYSMLTGQPPFVGASPMKIIAVVLRDAPAPPRSLRPDLDPDLEAICLRCLEKDPARRYATARALEVDLGRWLDGEPVLARPRGAWTRLAHALPSGKWLALGAASLVLVTGVGVAAVKLAPGPTPVAPPSERGPRNQGAALLARGEVAAAIAAFGEVLEGDPTNLAALTGRATAHERLVPPDLRAARADLDRAIPLAPERADLRLTRGTLRRRLGDPAGAVLDLERARALGVAEPAITSELLRAHLARAAADDRADEHRGVIAACSSALALNPRCAPALALAAAAEWRATRRQLASPDDRRAAVSIALLALDVAERADRGCARVAVERARLHLDAGNWDWAFEPADEGVRLARELVRGAAADPQGGVVDTPLALAFLVRGQVRAAEARAQDQASDGWIDGTPEARAQELTNRIEAALADVDAAAALEPTWPLVHQVRARLLNDLGRSAEALMPLAICMALAPGDAQAFRAFDQQRRKLAPPTPTPTPTQPPPSPPTPPPPPAPPPPPTPRVQLTRSPASELAFFLAPDLDVGPGSAEATTLADLEAHAPTTVEGLLLRSSLRARLGDTRGAHADVLVVLSNQDLTLTDRRLLAGRRSQLQQVIAQTGDAPDDVRARALFDRAHAHLHHRRIDGALAFAAQAVALRPNLLAAIRIQVQCLLSLRRLQEALVAIEQGLKVQPDDLNFLWQRANARRNTGDVAGALLDLDAYAERAPNERAASSARALAAKLRGEGVQTPR